MKRKTGIFNAKLWEIIFEYFKAQKEYFLLLVEIFRFARLLEINSQKFPAIKVDKRFMSSSGKDT